MKINMDEVLEHHGVKGMRWGVRKDKKGRSSSTQMTKYKKPPSKLSDAELARRIKRLETEKRYNDLNSEKKNKGKKFASDILVNSGKQSLAKLVSGVLSIGLAAALAKKLSPEHVKKLTS
jgi:hypothetical protein